MNDSSFHVAVLPLDGSAFAQSKSGIREEQDQVGLVLRMPRSAGADGIDETLELLGGGKGGFLRPHL